MLDQNIELAVIGGGPAGLAAAISAAEAGLSRIVIFDRQSELGGILPQCIHNGFGLRYFKEELTGPEYAWRFIERLQDYPAIEVKTETMVLELREDKTLIVIHPDDGMTRYHAKAVILAMGCRERARGAIHIPGTRPAGVFTAGTVQRLMNIEGFLPGRKAVILGSGDIGLIMARRLTLEGVEVPAVLELLPYSNGLNRNIVQCLQDYDIPLRLSHTVVEIFGDRRVTGVQVAPVDKGLRPIMEESYRIDCDTLVLSVGLIPENELAQQAGVVLDPATSGPWVGANYETSVSGIFACGNVAHVHDLVDDVSEESAIAGQAAAEYVQGNSTDTHKLIPLKVSGNIRSVVPQRIDPTRETTLYIRVKEPERDVHLTVGHKQQRFKIVNPGESIRCLIKPSDLYYLAGTIQVSLEKEDDAHD